MLLKALYRVDIYRRQCSDVFLLVINVPETDRRDPTVYKII
jgi:hypothetical protein